MNFSPDSPGLAVHKDPKDVEHRLDGLRKAGLPES